MRTRLIGVASLIVAAGGIMSSNGFVQAAQPATKFSSTYTTTATDCKDDGPKNDNGSDTPLICKGSGVYTLSIGYSAFGASLSAKVGENYIPLGSVDGGWDQARDRKLEWRLANGKPFAVIYRVNVYRNVAENIENGKSPFTEADRTGSSIVIVGLAGFENLKGEFDGKDAKANAKARALADAAYSKR
jgi:hypothetical protein